MKQMLFIAATLLLSVKGFSQSAKYVDAMKKNISAISDVGKNNNAADLANSFQRIAEAERTQWLPYYYAAYLTALQAVASNANVATNDVTADKATELLDSAQKILGKENSEIYVVRAMIATAHMIVDPQSRYMQYGPEISNALATAKKLDSTNPRPVLLEAENLFYTPEFAGGGKDLAKPLFEKAKQLFVSFKPETDLSPNWGKSDLEFFMKNYQ